MIAAQFSDLNVSAAKFWLQIQVGLFAVSLAASRLVLDDERFRFQVALKLHLDHFFITVLKTSDIQLEFVEIVKLLVHLAEIIHSSELSGDIALLVDHLVLYPSPNSWRGYPISSVVYHSS